MVPCAPELALATTTAIPISFPNTFGATGPRGNWRGFSNLKGTFQTATSLPDCGLTVKNCVVSGVQGENLLVFQANFPPFYVEKTLQKYRFCYYKGVESSQKIPKNEISALRGVLGLSKKEERVLIALQGCPSQSVLEIAATAKVSRPSVYDILKKLKGRGLVKSHVVSGHRRFSLESPRTLYRLKKDLLSFVDGREEVGGMTDGTVVVYRGREAVREKIFEIFSSRANERFLGYQGFDDSMNSWFSIFTPEEISDINRLIKQRHLITEAVLPAGWLKNMLSRYGLAWAKDYEGRTAATSYIDSEYFDNQSQMFAFKDAVYLIALNDQIILELRHSDIQKMILTFYRFMRDHGRTIDLNGELRRLIDGATSDG